MRQSNFNLCFNSGPLGVCVRCCSLCAVEGIPRRSCPSLSRKHGSRDSLVDFHTGLKSGLEAKSRTEDETGIVFLQPQHMQHGVYTILSRWWTSRKKELKKRLEMWGT